MRKLSEQHKIPGRSLPEIVSRFDGLVSRQQNIVGRKIVGGSKERKVPAEAITNAIILHFLDLSASDQDAILDRYVPELDQLMGSPEPGTVSSLTPRVTADVDGASKGKRKSG